MRMKRLLLPLLAALALPTACSNADFSQKTYNDGLKKRISDKEKMHKKCEEMYHKAQWAGTDRPIFDLKKFNGKKQKITLYPNRRIYIDSKTKEIYLMGRGNTNLQGKCYINTSVHNDYLGINRFNPKPRKLNKKFNFKLLKYNDNGKLYETGTRLQPIFKIDGDKLVAYTKWPDGDITRIIWGVRREFRETPNYTKAFSEPKLTNPGFGELPTRKGDYLLCSNGSEITSKLFINDPIVPLTPKWEYKRVKVKNPDYKEFYPDGRPTMMSKYIYVEKNIRVDRSHFYKNDQGQVTAFSRSSFSQRPDMNKDLYLTTSESLYGVTSQILPIDLVETGFLDKNGNVIKESPMQKIFLSFLVRPLPSGENPYQAHDIRQLNKGSVWSYKYSGKYSGKFENIIGKELKVHIDGKNYFYLGDREFITPKSHQVVWDLSRAYCLKEKNKFLLRVVEVRNIKLPKDKYGQETNPIGFIQTTNFYFKSTK